MTQARSLRTRLMVLILVPLIAVAAALGAWRAADAMATAEDLFDRSLLAATLAISRDVAVSGGDALSITTRDLVSEAAGGQIYYHVAGPDRVYITGYAYPPVRPTGLKPDEDLPTFYEALYWRKPVRAMVLLVPTQSGPVTGLSTVTVWQRRADRLAFARAQILRSLGLLAAILTALAAIIWFGVNRGLRPLADLEQAIGVRSSSDLGHIRRAVPREVRGIVSTLNALFDQVAESMRARDVFISNAAHQLRNPAAGMLALAEAAQSAGSEGEKAQRLAELKAAAERSARLTTQMLAFERLQSRAGSTPLERLDLDTLVTDVATRSAERILNAGVAFDYQGPDGPVTILGDRVMLEEAVENLIDNALRHGPPDLTRIAITLVASDGEAILTFSDDGTGLAPEDAGQAFERFSQLRSSDGSGLGLAIVAEVAGLHGANVAIDRVPKGASLSITFKTDRKSTV